MNANVVAVVGSAIVIGLLVWLCGAVTVLVAGAAFVVYWAIGETIGDARRRPREEDDHGG